MSEARFPTAPPWLRPILHAETALLRHVYPHLRRAREARGVPVAGSTSNGVRNVLGNTIPERAVPGHVPGWTMGQHAARYAWAMAACSGRRVVELGSGDGYGAFMMSWVAASVVGLDLDGAVIAAARGTYPGVHFQQANLTQAGVLPDGDIALAFEVLEHLGDARAVLAATLQRYPRLLASFPNPLYHGSHLNPHHVQDWTIGRLKRVLAECGATSIDVYHQGRRGAEVRCGGPPWSSIWIVDVRAAR